MMINLRDDAALPSPLRGEGRRERSERGVRGVRAENYATTPHPRPLSPEGRGENGLARAAILAVVLFISSANAADKVISYDKDVMPIFRRNCTSCHRAGKAKGDLDLSTFAALLKGGKHGPSLKPGDHSLVHQISGEKPKMPEDGDSLTPAEVATITAWVNQGGKDDTPAVVARTEPPKYKVQPVISAIAYSPDGKVLAVSGYHEVLLHKADGSGVIARLICESPRIESLTYSKDGKLLAACGGAPGLYGQVLIWETADNKLKAAYKVGIDSLFGISFSPEADKVAFGGADKTMRMISIADGKELLKFDNHADWVFGTAFTKDGKRLLSGSRDKAMKLIDVTNGQLIDDINKLLEPILCMSRDPNADVIAYGGELGTPRIYKMAENQQRTAANNDTNMMKTLERQPGPVCAIAYSPDSKLLAVGSTTGEVRLYNPADGKRGATLSGHNGAVFSIAFNPDGKTITTGGFDGMIRIFETDGKLVKTFSPVTITN